MEAVIYNKGKNDDNSCLDTNFPVKIFICGRTRVHYNIMKSNCSFQIFFMYIYIYFIIYI